MLAVKRGPFFAPLFSACVRVFVCVCVCLQQFGRARCALIVIVVCTTCVHRYSKLWCVIRRQREKRKKQKKSKNSIPSPLSNSFVKNRRSKVSAGWIPPPVRRDGGSAPSWLPFARPAVAIAVAQFCRGIRRPLLCLPPPGVLLSRVSVCPSLLLDLVSLVKAGRKVGAPRQHQCTGTVPAERVVLCICV